MTGIRTAALVLALAFAPLAATAEEIVVSNYGVTTNGMPFAVAMAKGFFKAQGADVTGILSSDGGGTTVRTMLGGNLAYGEINPTATVIAIQQPGAGDLGARESRPQARRCRAGKDRRLRRGHRGARSRRGRHHADPRA